MNSLSESYWNPDKNEEKIRSKKKSEKEMSRSGFEPETYCVLGNCDNQLHHRDHLLKWVTRCATNCVSYH